MSTFIYSLYYFYREETRTLLHKLVKFLHMPWNWFGDYKSPISQEFQKDSIPTFYKATSNIRACYTHTQTTWFSDLKWKDFFWKFFLLFDIIQPYNLLIHVWHIYTCIFAISTPKTFGKTENKCKKLEISRFETNLVPWHSTTSLGPLPKLNMHI